MIFARFGHLAWVAIAAALGVFGAASTPATAQQTVVAVTAIVEHPALDATRDGVKEVLEANGYKDGENLKFMYESAQGNPGTAAQIARKFVGERPDVIVAIATPSAQAVVSATKDIPVVFTAVTDPLGAKLISNLEKPGGNVTGLSDLSPITQHLELIGEISPEAKRVGVPFNPGEPNAVTLVNLLKQEAPKLGLGIVTAAAPRSSDVLSAARSLVGKVDVIYVPTDNTIVTALESVIKVGIENQIPVYAGDTDSVPRGAVAALGFDYGDIGRQTGEIILRVLKGEKPGDIPVRVAEGTDLYVNPGSAGKMGVTLPQAVIKRATKVVE
jgi:putative ABC transport system substrate-binding protein